MWSVFVHQLEIAITDSNFFISMRSKVADENNEKKNCPKRKKCKGHFAANFDVVPGWSRMVVAFVLSQPALKLLCILASCFSAIRQHHCLERKFLLFPTICF